MLNLVQYYAMIVTKKSSKHSGLVEVRRIPYEEVGDFENCSCAIQKVEWHSHRVTELED